MRAGVSLALILLIPMASAAGAAPGQAEIVVRADIARAEIERILNADNLDREAMNPQDIADALASIPRGHAPEDFWQAYQEHVDAWMRLAELTESGPIDEEGIPFDALENAGLAISLTFGQVQLIALTYGAKLPLPMQEVRRTA